ncbi:MAG TPA: DUF3592 domain-containing protein [Thermoanaerobaculia bacterium]|nr:DUF3592 domain-containing protein [Thermoanaerobaculia bacterium]
MPTKPLSSRRTTGMSSGCLALFFSVFLVAGCAIFYFMIVGPAREYLSSHSWQETTCTVLTSRVGEHSDSDGTTYSVDVVYTYSFGGRGFQSDRFGFLKVSSSGYDGKARTVARYPPGAKVPCWVDPEHPDKAVLHRELSWDWLFALLPLAFIAVGGGGLVWAVRSGRQAKSRAGSLPLVPASPFGVEPPPAVSAGGPLELKPTMSPLGKLLGLLFVSLFWNGIVSVFLFQVVGSWRSGQPNGCFTAFLIPFVLVGLGLIYGTIRQFLVLFNPRPRFTLNPGVLTTGGTGYLQWSFAGRSGRVRRLTVVLEGREEARYRRGTDTYTDRNTFASIQVIDAAEPYTIANGSTSFSVPADTVPTFKASHNKILWSLKICCEIPGWPDSDDEYEVLVRPGGAF